MINQKFFKHNRLLKRNDFLSLKDGGHFLYQNSIYIFHKSNDLNKTRLGISISKKIGKANIRNRYKRIIRECFRKSNYKNLSRDLNIVINGKRYKTLSSDMSAFEDVLQKDFLNGLNFITKQ